MEVWRSGGRCMCGDTNVWMHRVLEAHREPGNLEEVWSVGAFEVGYRCSDMEV